jgi:hypothetical protein
MKPLVLSVATTIIGIGSAVFALMHGDLGRAIDWFFASYAAPVAESVVGALLLWVMLRALWGWMRAKFE